MTVPHQLVHVTQIEGLEEFVEAAVAAAVADAIAALRYRSFVYVVTPGVGFSFVSDPDGNPLTLLVPLETE